MFPPILKYLVFIFLFPSDFLIHPQGHPILLKHDFSFPDSYMFKKLKSVFLPEWKRSSDAFRLSPGFSRSVYFMQRANSFLQIITKMTPHIWWLNNSELLSCFFPLCHWHPLLHAMQKGITRHLLDLVADLKRHSCYSSQCWKGKRYSGALHARLWMLFKKVRGVWLCWILCGLWRCFGHLKCFSCYKGCWS